MEHRGIEYTIVQGIERGVWKWSGSVADVVVMGQAPSKAAAVSAAEKAIDRGSQPEKGSSCPAAGRNEHPVARLTAV
jgi:hypothetical protein